jgi:hypothetical protein
MSLELEALPIKKNGDINIEWEVEEGTNTSLDTIYKMGPNVWDSLE